MAGIRFLALTTLLLFSSQAIAERLDQGHHLETRQPQDVDLGTLLLLPADLLESALFQPINEFISNSGVKKRQPQDVDPGTLLLLPADQLEKALLQPLNEYINSGIKTRQVDSSLNAPLAPAIEGSARKRQEATASFFHGTEKRGESGIESLAVMRGQNNPFEKK